MHGQGGCRDVQTKLNVFNVTEFMKRLAAIPLTERRQIDMGEAMNRILATKYPCL